MKNLTTFLLLAASLSMPLSAMAASDLNDVTMDVINLNDSHANSVVKQIDLPNAAERGDQERDNHSRSTKVNKGNDLSEKESEREHANKMGQTHANEVERENSMQQQQANEIDHENQMEQERNTEMERENTVQQDQQQQFDRDSSHGVNVGSHGMSPGDK